MNTMKTFILMLILTSLLLLTGLLWTGDYIGVIIFFFIALGINFFAFWSSDRLVLKMSKARRVEPDEAPDLHAIVDEEVFPGHSGGRHECRELAAADKPRVARVF